MSESFLGGWAWDVYVTRWVIFVTICFCIVIALIYVKLMDWFAVYMAWISVIVIELGFIGLGSWFFHMYRNNENHSAGALWGIIICWTLAFLYCLFLTCCCRNLQISIAVIETAADWLADTKRIFFMPLIYFCMAIGVFILWAIGILMV